MSSGKRPLSDDKKESDEPSAKRQKIGQRLLQQFQNTLQNETFTDVTFILGLDDNTETFDANKLLFSTRSEVFKAMLFGPMAQQSPINIPDVNPLAFDYLHQLFYMKQPQLTYDIIIHVLYAAQKYLIDIVIDECKQKLYTINNMDDLYLILNQMEQYSSSVFEDKFPDFFENAKFITENTQEMINDVRFNALQPFIVQNVIKTDVIPSEITKYESVKNYCIQYQKDNSNDYDTWQSVFKDKFIKFVKFRRLSTDYLLENVANDDIVPSKNLLKIINETRKAKQNSGFKLSDILLTYPQRKSLKVGDFIDFRDANGWWYEGKVVEKNVGKIEICFVGFGMIVTRNINDWQWIAKHKSVTMITKHKKIWILRAISRPCMKNVKKGDYIYVNCAYHPLVGEYHENKWVKQRIHELRGNHSIGVIISRLNGEESEKNEYGIHGDSQNECICINDECEYCSTSKDL